jgi:hypothetical protein
MDGVPPHVPPAGTESRRWGPTNKRGAGADDLVELNVGGYKFTTKR